MATDYSWHEEAYQRRKREGAAGFDKEQQSYTRFQQISATQMASPHVPRSGRLLELGCGAGNMTLWLVERGYQVSAIDLAPTAIAWTRERLAQAGRAAELRVGSVLELSEWPALSFDVVFDSRCLHCIIGEDRAKCLASIRRVLKPGGALLVCSMMRNARTPEIRGFDPATGLVRRGEQAIRYIGTPELLSAELERAGLRVAETGCDTEGDVCDDFLAIAIKS
ncbi:MAG: class I SAM-dependent methyltransferase [Planctomycetota bacterium]